jgi:hypothetical protein
MGCVKSLFAGDHKEQQDSVERQKESTVFTFWQSQDYNELQTWLLSNMVVV